MEDPLSLLAPLACPVRAGEVLTAGQGSSAVLWCSSPSTHTLGTSPQAGGFCGQLLSGPFAAELMFWFSTKPIAIPVTAQPQPLLIHTGLKGRRTTWPLAWKAGDLPRTKPCPLQCLLFGSLCVISWFISFQKAQGLSNGLTLSTALGAQLVALEKSYCQALVSGPRKSVPVGQGWSGPAALWTSIQIYPISSPQRSKVELLFLLAAPGGCNMDCGSQINEKVGGEVGHIHHKTCHSPASHWNSFCCKTEYL